MSEQPEEFAEDAVADDANDGTAFPGAEPPEED